MHVCELKRPMVPLGVKILVYCCYITKVVTFGCESDDVGAIGRNQGHLCRRQSEDKGGVVVQACQVVGQDLTGTVVSVGLIHLPDLVKIM